MGTAREILQDEDLIEEDDEASVDVMDATRELEGILFSYTTLDVLEMCAKEDRPIHREPKFAEIDTVPLEFGRAVRNLDVADH
ncbi:hypothetical protein PI125_g16622 [Phytophthora idaei]|nr:hypothetical protein PI125_g16622 [Phytophthora idaei]KAG3141468.1 hypothetical protein PI126_g15489 [Phytophthora idaei]